MTHVRIRGAAETEARCRYPLATFAHNVGMGKTPKLTRAERRSRRESVPDEGVYGVDAEDAGADTWTGRYLFWASSAEEATRRVRDAGVHKKQVRRHWSPAESPPEGLPDIGPATTGWYRSRRHDSGWTAWEVLPAEYRHPPQSLAAIVGDHEIPQLEG